LITKTSTISFLIGLVKGGGEGSVIVIDTYTLTTVVAVQWLTLIQDLDDPGSIQLNDQLTL